MDNFFLLNHNAQRVNIVKKNSKILKWTLTKKQFLNLLFIL